ncbi:hypothetical protein [Aquabacterium sp.]|uniref:hypothetical protein n=1 Tax=Aquabacterium sp. TaxID=1872578 RepID=UPI003B6BF367
MNRSQVAVSAHLVWLLYNPARSSKGVDLIKQIARSTSLDRIIVVWNGKGLPPLDTTSLKSLGRIVELLEGSNCGREFGGYQEGLDHLQRQATGGVYFLNDTAGVHNYLPQYFVHAMVSAALRCGGGKGVCVGHVDRALQMLEINGLTSDFWIRSNLFYLDSVALESLKWKVYSPEIDALVPGDLPDRFYAVTLSSPMQERINRWMFQPGKKSWYGAATLTRENVDFMAGKVRSILQEYYFTMRVSRANVQVSRTDMNMLQLLWFKLINRIGRITGYLK